MDLAALLARTRALADDAAGAALWTDEDLTAYLNEAQQQAAIRAKLLLEIENDEYCEVALVEDERTVVLPDLVWEVRSARRRGSTRNLDRYAIETLEFAIDRGGPPEGYALFGPLTAATGRKLVLDRAATEDGFLDLVVYRLPLALEDDADEPEIDDELHESLCYWALHKAYLHRDYDAEDHDRSQKFLGLFVARFGFLPDANVQRKQRRHRASVVRPGSYP